MRLLTALPLALAAVVAAAPAPDERSAAARLAGWLRLQPHAGAVYVDEPALVPAPTVAGEHRTLWGIINEDEHFKDLAHVLNYSSSATKKLLDGGEQGLTLLAPVNWHREHRDAAFGTLETGTDAGPLTAEPALSAMTVLEQAISAMHTLSDDDDKERRRRFIQLAIDATLRYHLVASPGGHGLKADDIAQNSSVATHLHVDDKARKYVGDLLAGEPFRVRTGKSLLPRPGVYFNFYSRLVYPDVAAASGSVLHAVSAPLFIPPSIIQALLFGEPDLGGTTTAIYKLHAERFLRLPHPHRNESASLAHAAILGQLVDGGEHHHHEGPHGDVGLATGTFFAPSNLAWKRLPPMFKAYLFSPWGARLLGKVLMLHSLPHDAVFADAIYSAKGSSKAAVASVEDASAFGGLGRADVQTYVFDSALPKIRCPHHGHGHDHAAAKEEMEKVTVKVYRYHILPGGRGPLQTRVEVQGVGVSFQDIPAANGAIHLLDKFIMPAGHGDGKGVWAEVAAEVTRHGFGDGAAALALM